jgi:hypothetical protein
VNLRTRTGEVPLAGRPAMKGALRSALRRALLARSASRKTSGAHDIPARNAPNDQRRSTMRRIPTLVGAGLVAAATASAIAVGVGSAQAPAERTLTFVERTVPAADVFADVPPLSKTLASAGDTYLFRNDVLDATGAAKLGSHEARCTYLRATPRGVGSRLICDGVYTLQDGTIAATTAFTFTQHPKIDFVVTGGSGAYEGAQGSGTLTYRPGKNNPLADTTIHLLP